MVAYSKGAVLATPHLGDQLVLTMPVQFYESGRITPIITHLGLAIKMAGQVDRFAFIFEYSIVLKVEDLEIKQFIRFLVRFCGF